MLYKITGGTVSRNGVPVLDHIDFYIKGKEKIGIVGKNGCGKSTLLQLIVGEISLDRDDKRQVPGITIARNTTIGYLPQNPWPDQSMTPEEELRNLTSHLEPYSREQYEMEQQYYSMLTGFGFRKEDKRKSMYEFSGGEQTKLAMIRVLLQKPDILILDEPTNHLDTDSTIWLEQCLKDYENAVIVVSHDRYFLDEVVGVIYEIDRKKTIRYTGNYTNFKRVRRLQYEKLVKEYKAYTEEKERLSLLIDKFKHKPNKASMARAKRKVLERMPQAEKPDTQFTYSFPEPIVPNKRTSKMVLHCDKLQIGYDDRIQMINLTVRRGQKIGIIGRNGTGKTTFLRTLMEEIPPIGGNIFYGTGLETGYYDQLIVDIPVGKNVYDYYKESFPEKDWKWIRTTLAKYHFSDEDLKKPAAELSGGERARLVLSVLLEEKPNVLILDEPTNHMDIPSKELLESALKQYEGTLIFITHDRYFLKEVAQSLLIFNKDDVTAYSDGYEHYVEMKRRRKEDRLKGIITADDRNQALISGYEAVPLKKRIQSAGFNNEQYYTDWQLGLSTEELRRCRLKFEEYLERGHEQEDLLRRWMDPEAEAEFRKKEQDYLARFTEKCISWYDKYLAYEEAFASYKE